MRTRTLNLSFATAITLAAFLFLPNVSHAVYGSVSTFLGKIYAGDSGTRTEALLDFPEDVEVTSDGTFYIADTYNNVIRKVSPAGTVSTYAGTGEYGNKDGTATTATFALPRGLAFDGSGNLYVADSANNRIRKISPSGAVSTLVRTGLANPQGVVVNGSTLYIADTDGNAIRKVPTAGGKLVTVSTQVKKPKKITLTAAGNLYVADSGTYRVLEVNVNTGVASVIAGSGSAGYWEGVGSEALFRNVYGVTRDGDTLYVSDGDGLTDYVRAINLVTHETRLVAQDSRMLEVNVPCGLRVFNGQVYVANAGISTIHRFNPSNELDKEQYIGSTRFGDVNGVAANVLLGRPSAMAITADGATMYTIVNNHIRRITLATGATETIIGDIIDGYGEGPADQASPRVRFSSPASLVLSPDGTALYVADRWNNRIRKVDLTVTPVVASLISGSGITNATGAMNNGYQEGAQCVTESLAQAGCAYFRGPQGIAVSPDGATLYVADSGNNRIRSVRVSDGVTSLIAGSSAGFADGTGSAAKFRAPSRLALSLDGATLYVADTGNHRIRAITLETGKVATLAGSKQGHEEGQGIFAALSLPVGLAMGPGNQLYISSVGSNRVTVVNTKTGLMTLVSGSAERGYRNGTWLQARFNSLASLALTPDGTALYVADSWNDIIRKVDVVGGPKFSQAAPVYSRFLVAKLKQAKTSTQTAYLDIFGKNFRNGVQVQIGSYKLKTFKKSGTNINMLIPWGKMKPGYYDVKITNRDTQFTIKRGAFAITDSKGNIPKTYYRIR